MRSLLTTLLMAAILVNLVIGAVAADAFDAALVQQMSGSTPYPTYVPDLLK